MYTIDTFSSIYAFLSNFYASKVVYEGLCYNTVEHAFQAAKTLSIKERQRISKADTPGSAKRIGRGVSLRPDWEMIKYNVMCDLVLKKFMNHKHLRTQLLMTNDAQLVEGNTWGDTIWGVCNGVGTNWLGKILMEVRDICSKHKTTGGGNMLTVYTAQYRYKGPNRVDITVKSAIPPWGVFAPTWDMVNTYLKSPRDRKAAQAYTEKYDAIVLKAFIYNSKALTDLIHSNKTRVLVCFCKPGDFCHRTLLAGHLESLGANYLGEINRWDSGKYEFV